MVGTQVGEHADTRVEARRVVKLKRRHLESDPLRMPRTQCYLGQSGSNVPRFDGIAGDLLKNVSDQRRGRRLSVGAGYRDDA
jgi:hypothetical protein